MLKDRDEISYIDIIDMLERGSGEVLYFSHSSGLIFRSSSGTSFIARLGDDKDALNEHIEPKGLYSVHDDETASYMERELSFECEEPCYIYGFASCSIEELHLDIKPLDESFIPIVLQHYDSSEEYIRERISSHELFGAFSEEQALMGFGGFHSEGAMGMLEVLPEYRRRGVGEGLERFLISEALRKGRRAYCNVYISNEKSIALQNKLGLKRGSILSHWIWRSELPEESSE